MSAAKVTAVVVTYNSAGYITRLLDGLSKSRALTKIVVLDNASSDESVAVVKARPDFGRLTLIESPENLGFGAAVNRAVEAESRSADFVAVINPDVQLEDGVIDRLVGRFSVPELAAVGVQLTRTDGTPVSSARYFPSRASILRRVAHEVEPENAYREVDWICGAFMLWRTTAFVRLGGFSSRYFLYYEDVDICRAAWEEGWRVAIDGSERAIHDQGHGVTTSGYLRSVNRQSRRRYAARWLGASGVLASVTADGIELLGTLLRKARLRS